MIKHWGITKLTSWTPWVSINSMNVYFNGKTMDITDVVHIQSCIYKKVVISVSWMSIEWCTGLKCKIINRQISNNRESVCEVSMLIQLINVKLIYQLEDRLMRLLSYN